VICALLLLGARFIGADATGAATAGPSPGEGYGFGVWSTKTD
jgi:hypothetical protein